MNLPLKIGQPRFLSLDEVLTLHRASIDAYGGADGVLDRGKLESALAMPRQGSASEFAHEFPFGMAAAYGFHLAMNHSFRDGNKRTAFAAMVVFLRMNGWNFELADDTAADLMLELIAEHRAKEWLTLRLQKSSKPRPSMELRDAWQRFRIAQGHEVAEAVARGGSPSEADASERDATSAIPVIMDLRSAAEERRQEGNEAAALRVEWTIILLVTFFRWAEHEGYEW